jgi:hypothetical protein
VILVFYFSRSFLCNFKKILGAGKRRVYLIINYYYFRFTWLAKRFYLITQPSFIN